MAPKRFQYEPEGHLKGPNMSQKGAKMTPKGAKGRSKVTPKATTIPQKIATSKKVEKGGCALLSFGLMFDLCLVQIASKNQCEKQCQTTLKIKKIKYKSAYDSIPRNAFSHRLSAKAVPPK